MLTLARAAHEVFASMRHTRGAKTGPAQELRAIARRAKLTLTIIDIDIRDDQSVAHGVHTVRQRAGRIDVLVNNAGTFYPRRNSPRQSG